MVISNIKTSKYATFAPSTCNLFLNIEVRIINSRSEIAEMNAKIFALFMRIISSMGAINPQIKFVTHKAPKYIG